MRTFLCFVALAIVLAAHGASAATFAGTTGSFSGTTTTFTVAVPSTPRLTNVVLYFNMNVNDLVEVSSMRLVSPASTSVTVLANSCPGTTSLNAIFDSTDADAFACTPVGKTMPQVNDLGSFFNQDPTGTWSLIIESTSGLASGSLSDFILDVQCCNAFMVSDIDLNNWSNGPEDSTSGTPGVWAVSTSASSQSVFQSTNTGTASYFDSDFHNVYGLELTASIRVSGGDDDFIGFALGRGTGNGFFVLQWKGVDQVVAGCLARSGMELVHVEDTAAPYPTIGDFWCAGANQPALQNKVMHIAYGNAPYNAGISGQNGWVAGRTYDFSFTMTETSLQIFVSDNGAAPVEVFNINNGPSSVGPIMGSRPWPNGQYSFINLSQPAVTYSGVTAIYQTTATAGCDNDQASVAVPFSGFGCYSSAQLASVSISWNDDNDVVDSGPSLITQFSTGVGGTIEGSHGYASATPNDPEVCVEGVQSCSPETCLTVNLIVSPPVLVTFNRPCPTPPILDVTVTGGVSTSYTYEWTSSLAVDPPQMTPNTEDQNSVTPVIPPARYFVTATDPNGCESSGSFELRFNMPQIPDEEIYLCGAFPPTATRTFRAFVLDSYSCSTTHAYTIDWGDGNSESGGLDVWVQRDFGYVDFSHVYDDFGDYTVTLCMTVDDSVENLPSGDFGCQTHTVTVASANGRVILPTQDDTFWMYIERPVTWEINTQNNADTQCEIQLRSADGSSVLELLDTQNIDSLEGRWSPGPHNMLPGDYSIWVESIPSRCAFEDPRRFTLVASPHVNYYNTN